MRSLNPTEFRKAVYDFYEKEGRSFPWRETSDPYAIMVSELMLQQTQTARVVEKYREWLKVFPTVRDLAEAPVPDVLRYWQGLGYNRRALNLQKAAKEIMETFGGQVPDRVDQLVKLPGIGPYTAGAVAAFAFNRPVPFIETNIRRVYLHVFFPEEDAISDKELMPLIEETLDVAQPRIWYYALMDYGAHLPKKVANPNRRSKHYSIQSKFEGSTRQARGRILKYLLEHGATAREVLLAGLGLEKEKIETALVQLASEGFIIEDEEYYQLKQSL